MRPLSSFVGQPIRSLQTMLRVIAEDDPTHLRIVPDGIYGPETAAAITVPPPSPPSSENTVCR